MITGDIDPQPTPGFSTSGLLELYPQPDSPYPVGLAGRSPLLEQLGFAHSKTRRRARLRTALEESNYEKIWRKISA